MMGIVPTTQAAFGAPIAPTRTDATGPADPMIAGPGKDPQTTTMCNYYQFTMKLRVYLK